MGPYRLTAKQCQTLTSLAAGHEVSIDPWGNPGKTGPLLATVDGLGYEVHEDGRIVAEPIEVPA